MRPKELLRLVSEFAKSGMLVWPRITAPAARSFATTVASRGAISSCPGTVKPSQPAVVTSP